MESPSPIRPIVIKKCICVECSVRVQVLIPLVVDIKEITVFLESRPFTCDECYVKEKRRSRL